MKLWLICGMLAGMAGLCWGADASVAVTVLVGYRDGVGANEVAAVEARHRLKPVRVHERMNLREYRVGDAAVVDGLLRALVAEAAVAYAERDQEVRAL